MAETTTTGRRPRLSRTMPATRSIAAALSTELPPNFITIMGARSSLAQPFGPHQLGVEQGRTGGAAQHVVREGDELPVEDIAFAQASDGGRHTSLQAGVLARLRAVRGVHQMNGPPGGRGQLP